MNFGKYQSLFPYSKWEIQWMANFHDIVIPWKIIETIFTNHFKSYLAFPYHQSGLFQTKMSQIFVLPGCMNRNYGEGKLHWHNLYWLWKSIWKSFTWEASIQIGKLCMVWPVYCWNGPLFLKNWSCA